MKIVLDENLELHQELNSKLFDKDNFLKEDVREHLIDIAEVFIEDLKENNIPLKVRDYWLVGSNASYNYTDKSDIDVHIIADIDSVDVDKNLLTLLYNYAKSSFNKNHNIKVKGKEVEVYIEGDGSTSVSNGIYSLKKNEWIKFPKKIDVEIINIEDEPLYKDLYKEYLNIETKEDIESLINRLYEIRQEGLASEGEFGVRNLIFKEFRNREYLQDLKDRLIEIEDKELSLEGLHL